MPKTATKRPMTLAEYKAKNEKANKDTRSPLAKAVGWDANKTQFIRDLLTGGNDVAGRGMIAGMLGAPGDIAGLAENSLRGLIGKPQVQPWGGSEHIGQALEQAGLVSDVRRPKTELLASLISPGAAAKTVLNAPKTAMTALRWMDNLDSAPTMARMGQRGAIADIRPDFLKTLAENAQSFDNPDAYRRAYTAEHLMDLSNPQNHRIGRIIEDGVDDDTARYMDAKYTADMYGSRGNNEYKYQREARVPDVKSEDDMVTIYRGADPAQKEMMPGDFVSFNREYALGHGDNLLRMQVPARDVVFQGNDFHEWIYSPEAMRGKTYDGGLKKVWDERANILERNGQPVTAPQPGLLGKMVAPQDDALRVAQANAAKPVSEGGLGLRPDNTPEERAAAMGFDIDNPLYHGTRSDVSEFVPGDGAHGRGVYMTGIPDRTKQYWGGFGDSSGGNVMPLYTNVQNPGPLQDALRISPSDIESQDRYVALQQRMIRDGYDSASRDLGGQNWETVVFDPRNIRSRFAAFDPMRRDSSDLLAGIAPFGAIPWLRDEQP